MNRKILCQARWLTLEEIVYLDKTGQERRWECSRRVAGRGAAAVVATAGIDGEPHVILVKQFRPPANCQVLEFPAGLIDEGETAASTGLRELAEETGYRGEAVEAGPAVYNSPGLSDERTALVRINATSKAETAFDAGEDIEVLALPVRGLKKRLLEEEKKGVQLDAKLWCFALGLEMAGK